MAEATLTEAPGELDAAAPARGGAFFRRILSNRQFLFGASLVLITLLILVVARLVLDPALINTNYRDRMLPPDTEHWFGTDRFGRDVFARIAFGAEVSLSIGAETVILTGLIGTLIGGLAGYFRTLDEILMRFMDALMAFPSILLAIAITAALGPSPVNVVIALTTVYTPRTARIMRATVMVQREMDYTTSAIAAGAGHLRILLTHILPNSLAPLIVQCSFIFAYAVLSEAVLSFLGLGSPPPSSSWGSIISEGRSFLREAWWITFFPGIAITITALGLNLAGDGLRDMLDPRLRMERD